MEFGERGETIPPIEVDLIAPEGFGYGAEIGISAQDREAMPGNEDLAEAVDRTIMQNENILVKVDTDKRTGNQLDDDGCGDGRAVDEAEGAIFGKDQQYANSLHRAKVMGGGATMAAAVRIGLGKANEEDLGATFLNASLELQERGIGFGGHTDTHGTEAKSGCGAIDRSVEILQAIADHRDDITNTIAALGLDTSKLQDTPEKPGILSNFAADAAQEAYNGKQVSDDLLASNRSAVFKRLAGDHQETRIVLNTVPGYTVNQGLIREESDGRAQAFAVDVWRLQRLAEGLYDTPDERDEALLSMLAYTLGTAAVLTKGDLPVYNIKPQTGYEPAAER